MATRKVLITGGSGMIGQRLTALLQDRGYEVVQLGRTTRPQSKSRQFVWDIDAGVIQRGAFDGVDAVVHLAGANLANGRWSERKKRIILESRVKSGTLLADELSRQEHQVKKIVSASGINYYGMADTCVVNSEQNLPGRDFLSQVVQQWETGVGRMASSGILVTKLRLGIVLSRMGGAFERIAQTVRWNIGAPLGTGRQIVSWVHIDDACNAFIHALEHETAGAYNVAAPNPVTNEELTMVIARILHRRLWLPHVPAWVLYLMFGELAKYVVTGVLVSSEKLRASGFQFQYPDLEGAAADLLQTGSA